MVTPPNQPYHANGVQNGHGFNSRNHQSAVGQAQSSMANMNLHTSSASASGAGGSRSMPMPPSPMPPPPPGRPAVPSTPGKPVPSTPGRAVPRFTTSNLASVSSAPIRQPLPQPPTPTAPRSVPGRPVAATPPRGPMVPPSNNLARSHPPPSPMQHQHGQQIHPRQSRMQPPPTPPPPPQRQQMAQHQPSNAPYNQPMQHRNQSNAPAPSPYRQNMPSMPPTPTQPHLASQAGIQQQHAPPRPPPMPAQNQNRVQPPPSPYHQSNTQNNTQQPPPSPMPMRSQPHPPPSPHMQQNSMQQQHAPPRPPPMPQQMTQPGYPQPPHPSQQPYPQQHHQQHQNQHSPQHRQYPQQQHQHNPNQPLQEKDKIDPSQIPRIPLFTRPHHAPATIYPSFNIASQSTNQSMSAAMSSSSTISGSPPPSDSRYVTSSEYENVSPRIMRSTVHTFPLDNATSRRCGDLPLGLVVSPLAGLSSLCGTGKGGNAGAVHNGGDAVGPNSSQWNGHDQGEIYGDSSADDGTQTEVDYIPSASDDGSNDPERIPVIRGPKKTLKGSNSFTRTLTPPRCDRCFAYLNPFCTPVSSSSFLRGAYSPVQYYNCNMCGTSSSISLDEESIANGTFDAATRCGTVEYEVGGAYCVRKEGAVQNVHLYGVEYVPPDKKNVESDQHHHHHHGSVKSHGWHETLNAIREVGRGLAATAPRKEDENGRIVNCEVKIGIFAFCQDMLVFPYLKRPKPKSGDGADGAYGQQYNEQDDEDAELAVAVVSDVKDDPFCPLPLHLWTHNVGAGLNSNEWKRFTHILDSFTDLMQQAIQSHISSPSPQLSKENPLLEKWDRNVGGAALTVLADALNDSGGKGTLITTRRPNYGVGTLHDREVRQVQLDNRSPYQRASDEQRLFTPLQHLPRSTNEVEWVDVKPGNFYHDLGERCARQRVCIDIVITSSLVSMSPASSQNLGPKAIHPNVRQFLDVATLAELCRATCGKFKWLRVGNECGVAVGDDGNGQGAGSDSFTGEQLREELKRSALSYMGSDAVFKLRCSHGVQVKSYCPTLPIGTIIGDGIVNSAELELSNIHSGTSIAVLLEHKLGGVRDTRGGRKGIDAPMVFFQSAVLYTSLTGQRRVRISTMGLVTTKVPADVFRSADLGTVTTIMTRQAISDLEDPNEGSLHTARSNIFQKCVSILANYRMYTGARSSPTGQLILPESLQLLPLFCLSLRKSRLFRNSIVPFKGPFPNADERAYHIFHGRMVSPNMSLQCVHPNLLQVSDMRTRDGEWITPPALETNKYAGEKVIAASMRPVCQLPKSMNPSIACLDEKSMYILDDRFAFYLFIGKDVPEEKWGELLSVSAESGVNRVGGQWVSNVPMGELTLASTESAHKLRNIIQQLRMLNSPNPTLAMSARHTYAPLVLVFAGRGSVFEEEMDSLLVDDPDGYEKSYVDFLCDVHRAVRQKSTDV